MTVGLVRLTGRGEMAEVTCLRVCLGMYSMQASGADLLTQREHGWPPGQDFLEVAQGWHFRRRGAVDVVVGFCLREVGGRGISSSPSSLSSPSACVSSSAASSDAYAPMPRSRLDGGPAFLGRPFMTAWEIAALRLKVGF